MKTQDLYVEKAIDYLNSGKSGMLLEKKTAAREIYFEVPKQYDNYAASFGTSLIQMGAKTTIYFYEAADANTEQNKNNISKAILSILQLASPADFKDVHKLSALVHNRSGEELYHLSQKIMKAAIALKIALRTYKIEENED